MSLPKPPANAQAGPPFDEAREMRELDAFLAASDPVDLAATDWHSRIEEGLDAAQQAAFDQWLAADPAHARAFADVTAGVADGVQALRALPAEHTAHLRATARATPTPARPAAHPGSATNPGPAAHAPAGDAPFPSPVSRMPNATDAGFGRPPAARPALRPLAWLLPRRGALALGLVGALAGGIGWQWWHGPVFTGSYAAEQGQRRSITLPDGSMLNLDAGTRVSVALYRNRRTARLEEGQLMASVTPDAARPFHVDAGPARISVLGTRFSVRYLTQGSAPGAGSVEVEVEQGRVSVERRDGPDSASTAPLRLDAGQGLRMHPSGEMGDITAVPPHSVGLWRQGMVRFADTPLADALAELERYGPTGLVIDDPAVARLRIGGSYEIARPDRFAALLPQILPVRLLARPDGRREIVRRN